MANAPKFQFTTPAGRLVMGSFFDLQKTDHENKALPEERYHWFAGLAIPKTTSNWWDEPAQLFQAIKQAAQSTYADTLWQSPYFSSKVEDGDGKNKEREGYAGCWIVKFTRNLFMGANRVEGPRMCDTVHNPIIDPMVAKKGYWYGVVGDCQANGKQGSTAGIFVNMSLVQLVAQGPEIITGPSFAQAFAGAQFNVPGGVAAPVQPAAAPAPSPAPAPAAAAVAPRMTPVSEQAKALPDPAAWYGSGWTDDMLVQHGHFTRAM